MFYSFQLWKHPNIYYRKAMVYLGRCELFSALKSLDIDAEIFPDSFGGSSFFSFECRELSPKELSFLAGMSCFSMLSEKNAEFLRPLDVQSGDVLPDDLPEIMKYKGKTNPSFTRMMLNVCFSLTPFRSLAEPVTVLDPLCGRGTTLFCALCMGADAVGIDADRKDLREALDYFTRYLKSSRIKHTVNAFSSTVRNTGIPGKTVSFTLPGLKSDESSRRSFTLYEADSSLAAPLLRKQKAHLMIADLPYGVQHAPQAGGKPEAFDAFLARVLPSWKAALLPGAAAALSFNSLTFKTDAVRNLLSEAGFRIMDSPPWTNLSHRVEQAVIRDVVFFTLPV